MIPGSPAVKNQPDWQKQLAEAVRDPRELLELLGLDPGRMPPPARADGFGLRVPRAFVARMRESDSSPVPGLIHKYASRVLLVASAACAVHCRYCFRRHFPYAEHLRHPRQLGQVLDYLRAHPEVEEVVLSGGDPLNLDDARLGQLVRQLERVEHLRTLRLHTRLPIVLPQRITPGLKKVLGKYHRVPIWINRLATQRKRARCTPIIRTKSTPPWPRPARGWPEPAPCCSTRACCWPGSTPTMPCWPN